MNYNIKKYYVTLVHVFKDHAANSTKTIRSDVKMTCFLHSKIIYKLTYRPFVLKTAEI